MVSKQKLKPISIKIRKSHLKFPII